VISYSFHPEAEAELTDASLFYESRMPGLGKSFEAEVRRTILLLREFPDAGSPIGPSRRRVLVARFPYSVVYRRDPDAVVIVAIAHQRRRPSYWRLRK
jgi:plasmid stabilization system protein ParE